MRSSTTGSPLMQGRTAVVTGAAQGIGFAVCKAFIDAGARVIVADLDGAAAASAADRLGEENSAVSVQCDVTSEHDVDRMIAACLDSFGSLDVLVNNAGITRDGTLRTMSLADFRSVVDVHLQGAWLGTQRASAVMREQKSGSIINMSSIAGKVGNAGQTNYSAAKAGLVGLTKASSKELARFGVRVNAIQPGLIRTPMTEGMRQDIWDTKLSEIPMGRAGEPGEIANTAVYLASDLSSYVTGAVIEVTGGRYM